MKYELFYLVGAGKEAELPKIKENIEKIVTANGGKFLEKETLEKRKLSYSIRRETHGIYIARRFDLEDGQNLKEINSKLNLDSGVLRFIISRADELPELMSKEERMAQQKKKYEIPKTEKIISEKPKESEKEISKKEAREKKEKSAKSEDIDKKLEEILNI